MRRVVLVDAMRGWYVSAQPLVCMLSDMSVVGSPLTDVIRRASARRTTLRHQATVVLAMGRSPRMTLVLTPIHIFNE